MIVCWAWWFQNGWLDLFTIHVLRLLSALWQGHLIRNQIVLGCLYILIQNLLFKTHKPCWKHILVGWNERQNQILFPTTPFSITTLWGLKLLGGGSFKNTWYMWERRVWQGDRRGRGAVGTLPAFSFVLDSAHLSSPPSLHPTESLWIKLGAHSSWMSMICYPWRSETYEVKI